MKTLGSVISGNQWRSCIPRVLMTGVLVLAGCNSKPSSQQAAQAPAPPEQKPAEPATPKHEEVGQASWYGSEFQGKETANGETFKQNKDTAASPSLPLGSQAEVTNLENGKKVEVKINDRGPYAKGRAIDLSKAAAEKLDIKKQGTAPVRIKVVSNGNPTHSHHHKKHKKPAKAK